MTPENKGKFQADLDKKFGDGTWTVVDYADDFDALWKGEHNQGVVVVWDAMPANLNVGRVDVETHLTPFDWALSYSRELVASEDEPRLRIVIHDVLSGKKRDAFGVTMAPVLSSNFPWITTCRRFEDLGACIGDSALRVLKKSDKPTIDLFAQIWINDLARDESHHDVNNLLGPMLLLDVMGVTSSGHRGRDTMLRHVHRLGLTRASLRDESAVVMLEGLRECVDSIDGNVRFVLVDDQVDQGWAHVVGHILNLKQMTPGQESSFERVGPWSRPGKIELWTTSSPGPLIDRLRRDLSIDAEASDGKGPSDLRFSLSFTDDGGEVKATEVSAWQEILLLDLRLGSNGAIDRSSLRSVVEIALELDSRLAGTKGRLSLIPNDPDWPSQDWSDASWDSWLAAACSPGNSLHAMALGFLASVIAATDMAYPIVIFSSTGQREIIEALRGSPNILTDFEKPRVLGSGTSDWFSNAAAQWRDSINQAAGIIHVRQMVQRLMQVPYAQPAHTDLNLFRHITIALDETGNFRDDDRSAIGGVIIETTGSSLHNAAVENVKFLEHLRRNGISFYDHVPAYTHVDAIGRFVLGRPLKKGSQISAPLRAGLDTFPNCMVGAFRCVVEQSEYTGDQFSGETYLKWLVLTLEILLAEYLPSQGWLDSRTDISIWLPQRTVGGKLREAQRFDFNYYDGRITTLGGHSVAYALVARSLEDRACFDDVLASLKSLKIRKIPYYGGRDQFSATEWYCVACKRLTGLSKTSVSRVDPLGEEIGFNPDVHRFCLTHRDRYLAADYSVAAHLADASVSKESMPGEELGECNVQGDLSFDVEAGERLIDFLQVARLFDRGFSNDAFRLGYRNDFFMSGLNRAESASARAHIERRLVIRLASHISQIDPAMVVELAMLPRSRFRKEAV